MGEAGGAARPRQLGEADRVCSSAAVLLAQGLVPLPLRAGKFALRILAARKHLGWMIDQRECPALCLVALPAFMAVMW